MVYFKRAEFWHRTGLRAGRQHLIAEAPQKVDPALIARARPTIVGCFWPVFFFADHRRITRTRTGRRPVVFRSILISIRPSRKGTLSSGRRRTFGCRRPQGRPTQARCHPCEDWEGGCAVDPRQYCRRYCQVDVERANLSRRADFLCSHRTAQVTSCQTMKARSRSSR